MMGWGGGGGGGGTGVLGTAGDVGQLLRAGEQLRWLQNNRHPYKCASTITSVIFAKRNGLHLAAAVDAQD
jgi:hypothetical protein